jgi:maltose-binding protein MalE
LSLPDLVALPHALLETAALKGLLHPYEGLTTAMNDPDWYEYARQLAHLQSSTFGLPFAGDALILVYRPAVVAEPPGDWPAALQVAEPVVFSAADPQALVTLALYQAAGGAVQDDQGRPFLDEDILVSVLTFYRDAEQAGLMPFWLTQYQSDGQVWEAFQENRANLAITWASQFLAVMPADTAAAPIPAPQETAFTLATGWVWALAAPRPDHHLPSAQLAEYLTDSSFLAEWTQAAGYLPPRPSALARWSNTSLQSVIEPVVLSAHQYPSIDLLTSLGPPLQQATLQVLKQQADPLTAAQAAVASLSAP